MTSIDAFTSNIGSIVNVWCQMVIPTKRAASRGVIMGALTGIFHFRMRSFSWDHTTPAEVVLKAMPR